MDERVELLALEDARDDALRYHLRTAEIRACVLVLVFVVPVGVVRNTETACMRVENPTLPAPAGERERERGQGQTPTPTPRTRRLWSKVGLCTLEPR